MNTLKEKVEMLVTSISYFFVNSLPNNKFLDWSKLKAFADNKIKLAEKLQFDLGRVENIVGKGENAGYQHFLLFLQCFQKASILQSLKVGTVWLRLESMFLILSRTIPSFKVSIAAN